MIFNVMNEPACRAYRAAQYLPSYTAAPTLNSTLRLSLTLTLLLQTPRTLNYRGTVRHPNRLRSPFCTETRSSTAHQQQVHNKSYKWSVGFNVNGRTFSVIAVRPTYPGNGIHTSHRHTDGALDMPGDVYNLQGCASFTEVLHWDSETRGWVRRLPHPASPSLSF